MARYTRTPISTLQGINNELAKVELAMQDTLDRTGSTPNYMDTDLDMNSRRILNLPPPLTDQEPLRRGDVPTGLSVSAQYVDDRFQHTREQGIGVWDTDTTYPVEGLAKGSNGKVYICVAEQSGNNPVSDGGTNWKLWIDNYDILALGSSYARNLNSRFSDYANVKDYGAIGDGTTDDTSAIQNAIDNNDHVFFPKGTYAVSKITFNKRGAKYYGNANFKGIASVNTNAVVEIVERQLSFEKLNVNQNFNINYGSAIHWYSLSQGSPAQFIKIKEMSLNNCIYGILFGQFDGTPVQDAPQSENSITHLNTRGCQTPIYFNQSNGFLFIGESTLNSLRNEWEIYSPGVYSYTDSRTIIMRQGSLLISNGELLKTDTQLGYGIEIFGGEIKLSNQSVEIASPNYRIHGGRIKITNSSSYMSNSSGDYVVIEPEAEGSFIFSNSDFKKPLSATSANKGFINHNNNQNFNIKLSNVELENFIAKSVFKDNNNKDAITKNTQISNLQVIDGEVTRQNVTINTNSPSISLLNSKGVDTTCETTEGWYLEVKYGGGTTLTSVIDAPTVNLKDKTRTHSLELNATGASYATTLDISSSTTIKATGIPVFEGSQVLISGWFRSELIGSQQKIGLNVTNDDGTISSFVTPTNQPALTSDWEYLQVIVTVPSGVKWAGVGVYSTTSKTRFTDLTMQVIN